MARKLKIGCFAIFATLLLLAFAATAVVFVQARRTPVGRPVYVALGSSFAAGAGLGPLQSGSPLLCARSVNGYPQQLARMLKLPIVDMSCGGAVTAHLFRGGQFFQGPQIRVITPETRLVTITVGGNDVNYVGDLGLISARRSGSLFGRFVGLFWTGPKPANRDYEGVYRDLAATLRAVHARAPKAVVVVATYPAIVPPSGTCPLLNLSAAEAGLMRDVGNRLAAATRLAAERGDAVFVDMNLLGSAHNACSADPWTRGHVNGGIAPFHPTLAGARATARAIADALAQRSKADRPTAIAPSGPALAPSPGAARKSSGKPAAE